MNDNYWKYASGTFGQSDFDVPVNPENVVNVSDKTDSPIRQKTHLDRDLDQYLDVIQNCIDDAYDAMYTDNMLESLARLNAMREYIDQAIKINQDIIEIKC